MSRNQSLADGIRTKCPQAAPRTPRDPPKSDKMERYTRVLAVDGLAPWPRSASIWRSVVCSSEETRA